MDSDKGKILLRISLALVFLWFGFSQFLSPSDWTGFVPKIVANLFFNVLGISSIQLVLANSILEIILGSFLLVGVYTRVSSLILAIHLFLIALPMGFSALAVRDFGLALATLAIFFNGIDSFSIDRKFK